jgi:hypothetical protein
VLLPWVCHAYENSGPPGWLIQARLNGPVIELRAYEDVYPVVEEIIEGMLLAGFERYATMLSFRMHEVPWTTRSELWRELVKALGDFETREAAKAPELILPIRRVVAKMREWFTLCYPGGLEKEYEDHPGRLGRSQLDHTDFYLRSAEIPGLKSMRQYRDAHANGARRVDGCDALASVP